MVRRLAGSGRRRTPLFWGIVFRIVLFVAAGCLGLSYLSIYVNPSKFGLPLFFGLFYIPILAVNVVLLLVAFARRSRSAWIPIIAILPSLLYLDLFVKIGGGSHEEKEGIKLTVKSYNVGTFSLSSDGLSRDDCRKAVISYINNKLPDILCLQEIFVDNKNMADTIFSSYRYRHYKLFKTRNGKLFGNMTLSRYPIVNTGDICFKGSTNLSVFTDINHYDRILRVFNNHLESYNVSFTALVKKMSKNSAVGEEMRNEYKEVHDKMLGTFIKRSDQVNTIQANIEKCKLPAIICGDFNDTPVSYTYHRLVSGRKDSFREAGNGFGGTFMRLWPLLRIDYILYPKEFDCSAHITDKIKLSDHYPVSAELII